MEKMQVFSTFSFTQNVFKIPHYQSDQKLGLCGIGLSLYDTIPTFNDPGKNAFQIILGRGENAGNQHFPLFPQRFLPFPKQISILLSH